VTDDVKLCPECNAEYYAYIENCAECDVALVRPGEVAPEVSMPDLDEADLTGAPTVCIAEGEIAKMHQIAEACEAVGIPYEIAKHEETDECASKGCGPERYGVFVTEQVADGARRALDAYMKQDSETSEARERMSKGLCPACGALTMSESEECPDCGLNLAGPAEGGPGGGCG
jgi:rRNA maturation protein Nop10